MDLITISLFFDKVTKEGPLSIETLIGSNSGSAIPGKVYIEVIPYITVNYDTTASAKKGGLFTAATTTLKE